MITIDDLAMPTAGEINRVRKQGKAVWEDGIVERALLDADIAMPFGMTVAELKRVVDFVEIGMRIVQARVVTNTRDKCHDAAVNALRTVVE